MNYPTIGTGNEELVVVTKITMYVQKGNQKPVWIPEMALEDPKPNTRMDVPNETTYTNHTIPSLHAKKDQITITAIWSYHLINTNL